jgi:proteasome lid subunit RPN8/RPN11
MAPAPVFGAGALLGPLPQTNQNATIVKNMQNYQPSRPSAFAHLKSVLPFGSLIGKNSFTAKPPNLKITREAYEAIRKTVGALPSETGGMLGGDREKGIITHFHFDGEARTSGATYSPNHALLGSLLKNEWNPKGVKLMGFVHSHPRFCTMPSEGDRLYAKVLLDANDEIEALHLPIVMSESGGRFELLPFVAMRDGVDGVKILPAKLEIIGVPEQKEIGETFARVSDLYDLERLDRCRMIAIGAGGAAAFLEDMARSGVGEMILIDPDTVSMTNLATQQVYRRDIGRPKVEAIKERLLDINPNARVEIRQA